MREPITGPAVGAIEPVTSIVLRVVTRELSLRELSARVLSVRVLSWLRRSRDMQRQQARVIAEMRRSIGNEPQPANYSGAGRGATVRRVLSARRSPDGRKTERGRTVMGILACGPENGRVTSRLMLSDVEFEEAR